MLNDACSKLLVHAVDWKAAPSRQIITVPVAVAIATASARVCGILALLLCVLPLRLFCYVADNDDMKGEVACRRIL